MQCFYNLLGLSLKGHVKKPYKSLAKVNLVVEAQRLASSLLRVEISVNKNALVHGHETEDMAMFTARISRGRSS